MRRVLIAVATLLGVAVLALGGTYALALERERRAQGPHPEGRYVETAAGPAHVLEWGAPDAPPVLLLHGTMAWGGLWAETAEALAAEGWRAVAMDLPPFGYAPRAAGMDLSRPAQARRVLALAAELGRPVLVAHSVGAGPGADALLADPDAFAGAVLVAPALGVGDVGPPPALPRPLRRAVAAVATHPSATGLGLRGFVHRDAAITEAHLAVLRAPLDGAGLTHGVADWLPTLLGAGPGETGRDPEAWRAHDRPLTLIWGREDDVTPLAQGERLAALAPDARLVVLDDVGHIPQIEAPAAFRAELLRALGAPRLAEGTR